MDAGLVWVGPPPAAMRALGDKARAKALAEQHGVPRAARATTATISQPTSLARARRADRLPAADQGQRRGRRPRHARRCESPTSFARRSRPPGARRWQRSATTGVLLERYVRAPAARRGPDPRRRRTATLVHLGERECSIQRRHQKLIEESPSPAVDADAARRRWARRRCGWRAAAGYANAGTVEFLLDEDGAFAFLEVNARLQVEHPVTEAVTGLDLVELQLRVAAGEPLPLRAGRRRFDGHAIEARVIAEDAAGGLPARRAGVVTAFDVPGLRARGHAASATGIERLAVLRLAAGQGHRPRRGSRRGDRRARRRARRRRGSRASPTTSTCCRGPRRAGVPRGDLHTGFLDEHGVAARLADVPDEAIAAAPPRARWAR